jgi:hypothetical protein
VDIGRRNGINPLSSGNGISCSCTTKAPNEKIESAINLWNCMFVHHLTLTLTVSKMEQRSIHSFLPSCTQRITNELFKRIKRTLEIVHQRN